MTIKIKLKQIPDTDNNPPLIEIHLKVPAKNFKKKISSSESSLVGLTAAAKTVSVNSLTKLIVVIDLLSVSAVQTL